VGFYFNNNVKAIKDYAYQSLAFEPTSFYILPTGNLVIASWKSQFLKIYNDKLIQIEMIDKINKNTFASHFLTSNGTNSIYITDCAADQIIKTDLDFNFITQFGSAGTSNQQLNYPLGITFHDNSIYVCDSDNKRIQKLNNGILK
jgi:DNA-binding beta-propeller fold protein YncE